MVNITGDNDLWFYADGQPIVDSNTPDYNNWRKTKHVSVPADTKVYGVKCIDRGVVGGIIASFSDGTVTDASWRLVGTTESLLSQLGRISFSDVSKRCQIPQSRPVIGRQYILPASHSL